MTRVGIPFHSVGFATAAGLVDFPMGYLMILATIVGRLTG